MIFEKNIIKKFLAILLVISFCLSMPYTKLYSAESIDDFLKSLPKSEYQLYLEKHPNARPNEEVIIESKNFINFNSPTGEVPTTYNDFENCEGVSILMPEESTLEWEAELPQSGYYNIEIEYYPVSGKSSNIEREFYINDELPFSQAAYLTFSRIWGNKTQETKEGLLFERDNRENDIKPSQIEKPNWMKAYFSDYMGYYAEPYLFYFEKGKSTVTLKSVREPMIIRSIRICQEGTVPSYDEVQKGYKNYAVVENELKIIEGESAEYKSDPMLYPVFDRSSPTTQPYHPSKIRLNTIGGSRWNIPGQWITWKVEVEKTGLYQISLKTRQNIIRGMYSNRRLTINGEVPFKEMENIRFKYNNGWQMDALKRENEPYLFYFEEGKTYELKLEAVLGDLGETLRVAEESVLKLNDAYRRIIMLTGTNPDPYRDYNLDIEIPEILKTLEEQTVIMESLYSLLRNYTGQRGSHNAIIDRLATQLKDLVKRPDTIPKRLETFKTNIGSLSQWIMSSREQPLEIDYIALYSPDVKLPKHEASFPQKVLHELRAFVASFFEDYNSIGDIHEDALLVWIGSGRDQGQILKSMIDESFIPEKKISVNLRIVDSGILLSSIIAGLAPDVALGVGSSNPVDFAIRGAVYDLASFDDFSNVSGRFYESALKPYRFGNGVFALPEQQVFPVMFYRKDIIDELGIKVPQTWDDIVKILPIIQKSQMDIGIPVSEGGNTWNGLLTYSILLYQMGGELYQQGGKSSGLDSDLGIAAFRKWTNFYVNYKFPMTYNIVNRFRTGEVPIAISDYSMYNVLSVFAPELRGLWDIAPIPGTVQADGTINRSTPGNGSAVIMLKDTDNEKEAWAFMKWWTSKDMQVRFAREMESLMGAAARYPTANIEAMKELPWTTKDFEVLEEQWKWVIGLPEVPGGYFTPRHLDNAFRSVALQGTDPQETILDYTRVINKEIDIKRKEFGLELRQD